MIESSLIKKGEEMVKLWFKIFVLLFLFMNLTRIIKSLNRDY